MLICHALLKDSSSLVASLGKPIVFSGIQNTIKCLALASFKVSPCLQVPEKEACSRIFRRNLCHLRSLLRSNSGYLMTLKQYVWFAKLSALLW